jgi:hypothetical protein
MIRAEPPKLGNESAVSKARSYGNCAKPVIGSPQLLQERGLPPPSQSRIPYIVTGYSQ